VHTHLDAQVAWDPDLTPISWHGVTTALLGNCGVTFAPCKPGDRELLAGMMETVEDIPREAILEGLSWNWESYGEYLNELQQLNPAINIAGLIGHCALRFYVMGERGVEEDATPEDSARMAEIVEQAVLDGAVGFSTSRFLGHYLPDGRHVPGTHAQHEELVAIADVVGRHGALMQNVMNFGGDYDGEMALLRKEAEKARVLFSHGTGKSSSYGNKVEASIMEMRQEGLDVNAIAIPRAFLVVITSFRQDIEMGHKGGLQAGTSLGHGLGQGGDLGSQIDGHRQGQTGEECLVMLPASVSPLNSFVGQIDGGDFHLKFDGGVGVSMHGIGQLLNPTA